MPRQDEKKTALQQSGLSFMTTLQQMTVITGAGHNFCKILIFFWLKKFVCDFEIAWNVVWCKASKTTTWQSMLMLQSNVSVCLLCALCRAAWGGRECVQPRWRLSYWSYPQLQLCKPAQQDLRSESFSFSCYLKFSNNKPAFVRAGWLREILAG